MANVNIENLQTGDILLFTQSSGNGAFFDVFGWFISLWTNSPYVHCAFVLRDPEFIHPSLKGLYIWESGWENNDVDPQDGKKKFGVQITPIYEYLKNAPFSNVFVRKLQKGVVSGYKLMEVHQMVYNKPYNVNIFDWLRVAFRKTCPDDPIPQTKRFWCSSFVAYILVQLNFINAQTNWDLIRPSDLSSDASFLEYTDKCSYGKDERIL